MEFIEVFKIVFGGIVLLFLPGYVWSYTLFKKHQVDFIERVVLSAGLSIAFVPLTALGLNYALDVQINLTKILIISVAWTAIPLAYFCMKKAFEND